MKWLLGAVVLLQAAACALLVLIVGSQLEHERLLRDLRQRQRVGLTEETATLNTVHRLVRELHAQWTRPPRPSR